MARRLLESGFSAANSDTVSLVRRWPEGSLDDIRTGASADYLIRSGQGCDLEFVLSHVADLDDAYVMDGNEAVAAGPRETQLISAQGVPRRLQSGYSGL
jgi:hypothetical protein